MHQDEARRIASALHALGLEGRETYETGFAVAPECDRRTKAGKAKVRELIKDQLATFAHMQITCVRFNEFMHFV